MAHSLQGKVDSLIYHYRDIGHFAASLDPLGTTRPFPENLTLESFGLSDDHLDETFDPGVLPLENPASLRLCLLPGMQVIACWATAWWAIAHAWQWRVSWRKPAGFLADRAECATAR